MAEQFHILSIINTVLQYISIISDDFISSFILTERKDPFIKLINRVFSDTDLSIKICAALILLRASIFRISI